MSEPSNKNSIVIISDIPIFNPKKVQSYQKISLDYTIYLNTLLISNWVEIFSEVIDRINVVTLLNSADREFHSKYLLPEEFNTAYYESGQLLNIGEKFIHTKINSNSNNLLIFCNSIGLTQEDIFRFFSLLQSDEPSVVIGKSVQNKITFICTSGNYPELIDALFKAKRNFEDYLKLISHRDILIHTLDKILSINDLQDIKKLYIELSKKESLSYCSQKMHESFNDLFIEYKELLNV